MTDQNDPDEEETRYTLDLNGKRYGLTDDFMRAVQRRAEHAYEGNEYVETWWKRVDGDPVLVIETKGAMVPWDKLDELQMEMEPVDGDDDDVQVEDNDAGNGMATVPRDDVADDDDEQPEAPEDDRTYFTLSPKGFMDVPQPEEEERGNLPPKPQEMDSDEPDLVLWIPNEDEIDERWETGEAIISVESWVEWNVQARADSKRLIWDEDEEDHYFGDDRHDQWEALCEYHECSVVGESKPSQKPEKSGEEQRKPDGWFEDKDLDPDSSAVGNRWHL